MVPPIGRINTAPYVSLHNPDDPNNRRSESLQLALWSMDTRWNVSQLQLSRGKQIDMLTAPFIRRDVDKFGQLQERRLSLISELSIDGEHNNMLTSAGDNWDAIFSPKGRLVNRSFISTNFQDVLKA